MSEIFICAIAFTFIALASNQIGQFFTKINLPLISGFLFAGIIAGPYMLGLISVQAVEQLRFVDEVSLAVIAFAAGSELYLRELQNRLKSIVRVTVGNVIIIPILGATTVFLLADFIPFMQEMTPNVRLGIAALAGAILVARSPSSAIAIVNELRARGPFTQTVLGVTMISDVLVIFLFALASSLADILITTSGGFDTGLLILLVVELPISLAMGFLLGRALQFVLASRIHNGLKISYVLLLGYGIFVISDLIRHSTHNNLSFEIFLEPLLACMIGGFVVTNYSQYRSDFLKILRQIAPPIYIAFFTLTGAALQLDILGDIWPIALALFVVRLMGIFLGSFGGGVAARDPMKHNRLSWLAYVTQAGIGLGLAKEVAVEFSEWGAAFATMIIAVIVINQIVGPPLFKWAIYLVKEAHTRAKTPEFDGQRDAIIFGLEGQSFALAHQLREHGWEVKIATRKANYIEEVAGENFDIHPITEINFETLQQLETKKTEAIITLLSDEENYQICELAYEHFGTDNLVVRLNDRRNFDKFHKLGALIVDPSTAIVSLLDHLVRSPTAASLLLGMEAGQDIIDLEVCNPNLHGTALRDLRLPLDTLILSVHRGGRLLISHGYTQLKIGDRVTIVGSEKSLNEVMLRFSPVNGQTIRP